MAKAGQIKLYEPEQKECQSRSSATVLHSKIMIFANESRPEECEQGLGRIWSVAG